MFDELIKRLEAIRDALDALLDELRGDRELLRLAGGDVEGARRGRTLVEAAPEEVAELQRLLDELPKPGSNGHGRHG